MKKLLAVLSLLSVTCLFAQDYAPFPEDSLFFKSEIPDHAWMPLVKSNDASDLIQKTNSWIEWSNLRHFNYIVDAEEDAVEGWDKLPMYSWLGKVTYDGDFISFKIANGDSIYIDTRLTGTDSYQLPLNSDLYGFYGNIHYLNVQLDDYYETSDGDSIKAYRFAYLDEAMEPTYHDFGNNYSSSEYDGLCDIENLVFVLSKNHGILESPSFYHFPYAINYERVGPITEELDLDTSRAYQVFYQEIGDEIHTEAYLVQDYQSYTVLSTKRICTDQSYDPITRVFETSYDVWTREDKQYKVAIDGVSELVNEMEVDFNQEIVTTDLDDYEELERAIPDGFSEEGIEKGYYYIGDRKSFRYKSGNITTVADSIAITGDVFGENGYDLVVHEYGLRQGGLYYDNQNAILQVDNYKVVYYNFNGEEWGDAFTDAYILDIEDQEAKDIYIFYENGRLYLDGVHSFENANIYDMNGRLISSFGAEQLSEGVSILDIHSGTYLLNLWNNSDRKAFKFIK